MEQCFIFTETDGDGKGQQEMNELCNIRKYIPLPIWYSHMSGLLYITDYIMYWVSVFSTNVDGIADASILYFIIKFIIALTRNSTKINTT